MKLLWTETAKSDLISIRRYIARNNPANATRWIKRLRTNAGNVLHAPYSCRKVPEFNKNDLREALEGNYRIVYLVPPGAVTILTIFEGHRLFPVENVKEVL